MEIECRFCKSKEVIKRGFRNNKTGKVQIYSCKSCKKVYSENTTFFKMKNKGEVICTALDLYFKNVSLRKISDHLQQIHGKRISHVTILKWVRKYSTTFKEYTDKLKVNGSGTIHADEMMVNVNGKLVWLWNVMDRSTKFLLSTHLSNVRRLSDAKRVMLEARRKLNDRPKFVVTDGLPLYRKAFNRAFWKRKSPVSKHIKLVGFRDKVNNNTIERLHGSIRERTKVMRGFHKFDSARKILGGWSVYYNFIRPHESLDGLTPAEASGINLDPNGGNRWLELIKVINENNGGINGKPKLGENNKGSFLT